MLSIAPALAVSSGSGTVTTPPTVTNWSTGWGETTATGWDYVGTVGGGSGVYLGNNWVITAGHIGAHDFLLDGVTYSLVSGSVHTFSTTIGATTYPADLVLFQISTAPLLPSLTISSQSPVLLSPNPVVMIGNGGGKSWGANTVTAKNQAVGVSGYVTADFSTAYGTHTYGATTVTNDAHVVNGDSGGAGFIYHSATQRWELSGLLEAIDLNTNDSYLDQLSYYSSDIRAITNTTAVPEPGWAGGAGAIAAALAVAARLRRRRARA